MRRRTITAIVAFVVIAALPLVAQPRMKPAVPGRAGDPVWQGILRTPDGRTFVTDGGIVIDAAIARPATLPAREFPPKLLQDYFSAPHTDEYGFSDLTEAATGKAYTTPNGIALSTTYIDFLRRVLPRSTRFRLGGPAQPVVVIHEGTPVGAFMPVRQ